MPRVSSVSGRATARTSTAAASSPRRSIVHVSHGSSPSTARRIPIGRMPIASARRMTSRPIGPMPSTPIVRPSMSSKRRGSQRWAAWSRSRPGRSRLSASRYIMTVRAIGAAEAPDEDVTRTPRSTEGAEDRMVGARRERVQPAQVRRPHRRPHEVGGALGEGVGGEERQLDPIEVVRREPDHRSRARPPPTLAPRRRCARRRAWRWCPCRGAPGRGSSRRLQLADGEGGEADEGEQQQEALHGAGPY